MARNRYLPFGFKLENGGVIPSTREAQCVRDAYEAYIDGASYASIAEMLQNSGIRYHADTPLWNKHMVKRMLENERYTGKDGYPAIIQLELFQIVASIREGKAAKCEVKKTQPPIPPSSKPVCVTTSLTDIGIVRLENQIKQELSRPVLEPERLKEMIFLCAVRKYEAIRKANNPIRSNQVDAGSAHFDI